MTRLAALLLVVAALAAALAPAAARAQGNDLLPPATGGAAATATPAPTATPTPDPGSSTTSRTTLIVIGLGLLAVFVAIGLWIARDARRALPTDHHRHRRSSAEPLAAEGAPRPRSPQVKQRARRRGKAQRHARRANRPR